MRALARPVVSSLDPDSIKSYHRPGRMPSPGTWSSAVVDDSVLFEAPSAEARQPALHQNVKGRGGKTSAVALVLGESRLQRRFKDILMVGRILLSEGHFVMEPVCFTLLTGECR